MWVRSLLIAVTVCSCTAEISSPGPSLTTLTGPTGSGGGDDHVTSPGVYDPTFKCDPTQTVLAPTSIKRLAKAQWLNTINELLSPLAAADRTALIASVQTQIDLVPEDDTTFSARTDSLLTQSHVDATFEVAFGLGEGL
jgi:hypothetical protein